jgi:proteic killer suppression protein
MIHAVFGAVAMIKSFRDRKVEAIFKRRSPGKVFPPDLIRTARRKLVMIHGAKTLHDLRSPPSNRLEAMKDDRAGEHSIRINDQWRVCFVWTDDGAADVEIVDYH